MVVKDICSPDSFYHRAIEIVHFTGLHSISPFSNFCYWLLHMHLTIYSSCGAYFTSVIQLSSNDGASPY